MEEEKIIYQPKNISMEDGKFTINEEGKKEIRESLIRIFGDTKCISNLIHMLSTLIIDMNNIIESSLSGKRNVDVVELGSDIAELEFYIGLIEEFLQIPKNIKNQVDLKMYETYYQRIIEFIDNMKAEHGEILAEENDTSETVN